MSIENNNSSIKEPHILNCLCEVERLEQFLKSERTPQNPPYEFNLPQLPEWTNKDLEFEGQIVNLNKLSCNCDDSKTKRKIYPKNDLRLICKHIYKRILSSEKYKNLFDELAHLLINSVRFNKEKMLIVSGKHNGSSIFYIGRGSEEYYYNIYSKANDKWHKYNYSLVDNSWNDDHTPNNSNAILEVLKRNEFIFDKYLNEEC